MITIPVASAQPFGKTYEYLPFDDTQAFVAFLRLHGRTRVRIIRVDPWDDTWDTIGDFATDELREEHLDMLRSDAGGRRYVSCGLTSADLGAADGGAAGEPS